MLKEKQPSSKATKGEEIVQTDQGHSGTISMLGNKKNREREGKTLLIANAFSGRFGVK